MSVDKNAPRRRSELNFKMQHLHPGVREGKRPAVGVRGTAPGGFRPRKLQGPFLHGNRGAPEGLGPRRGTHPTATSLSRTLNPVPSEVTAVP